MKPNNMKNRPNGDQECLECDFSIVSEAVPSFFDKNDGIGREVEIQKTYQNILISQL